MRTLLALAVGLLVGAGGFHAWYLRLAPAERCTWDHPLDERAKTVCRQMRSRTGYDAAARRALDRLIEDVGPN